MNRIRQLRTERGFTTTQLGKMVDTSHATISRIENGQMQLTQDWAEKIAGALGVRIAELFADYIPATTEGLPVLGEVAAGVWREAEVADEPKEPPLPMGFDRRYPRVTQFALRVVGDSMNLTVPDGAYIVCISWAEVGRDPRENDIVVVERRRDGLIETTVKRIKFIDNQIFLFPESNDPRWQKPIPLVGSGENDEIVITAKVVGKYEPF